MDSTMSASQERTARRSGQPRRGPEQPRDAEQAERAAQPEQQDAGHRLEQQIVEAIQPVIGDLQQQISETLQEQLEDVLRSERVSADAGASSGTRERSEEDQPSPLEDQERVQASAPDTGERGRNRSRDDQRGQDEGRARQPDESRPRTSEGSMAIMSVSTVSRNRAPARRPEPGEHFDSRRSVPVALLRLGRAAMETGNVYTAIHAYTQVLELYPNMGAANAAAEGLVEIAEAMEQEGKFYTSLNILRRLEQLSYDGGS
jgi:TolA-binding protein